MDFFKVSNHPLWVGLPSLVVTYLFWVGNSVWVVLPLLRFGLVYLKKVFHHP